MVGAETLWREAVFRVRRAAGSRQEAFDEVPRPPGGEGVGPGVRTALEAALHEVEELEVGGAVPALVYVARHHNQLGTAELAVHVGIDGPLPTSMAKRDHATGTRRALTPFPFTAAVGGMGEDPAGFWMV